MTLDEAIKHAEEVAEEHTKYNIYGGFESCDECAEEHRQLAEWLKDYKRLLEHSRWIPIKSRPLTDEEKQKYLNCELGYTDGLIMDINDGLDEFSIFECELPDLDEENVLVTTKFGYVCSTTFYRDIDYGCYFEGFEDEGDITAWMPLPEPYEPQESEG